MTRSLIQRVSKLLPSVITRFAGAALQLLLNMVLGRVLGASSLGIYYSFDAWQRTVGLVIGFGMPPQTLRSISRLFAARALPESRRVLRHHLAFVASIGALVGLALVLGARPLALRVFDAPELVAVIAWSGLSSVLYILVRILAQALKGVRRSSLALFVEFTVLPIGLLTGAATFVVFDIPLTAVAVISMHVATLAVSAVLGSTVSFLALQGPRPTDEAAGHVPAADVAVSGRTLAHFWGTSVLQMAFTTAPILLLPAYATQEDVAYFGVSTKLLAASGVAISALASYYAPRFATSANDPRALQRRLRASQLVSLALFLPFFLVFTVAAEPVLRLFGPEFVAAAFILRVLAVGQLISAASGLISYLASMVGLEREAFASIMGAFVVLLILIHVMGTRLGGPGVAFAYTLAIVVRTAWLYVTCFPRKGRMQRRSGDGSRS